MANNPLIQNIDYYLNADGNMVFTETYLLKRGFCCQSGCLHCPYGYSLKVDPNIPAEFSDAWGDEVLDEEDENNE
jgi:hypothetical protein